MITSAKTLIPIRSHFEVSGGHELAGVGGGHCPPTQSSFSCFCHLPGQSTILPAGEVQTLVPSGSFFPPRPGPAKQLCPYHRNPSYLLVLRGTGPLSLLAWTVPTSHLPCFLPGPYRPPTTYVPSQPSPAYPARAPCWPHNKAEHLVWPGWVPHLPPLPPGSALALLVLSVLRAHQALVE